MLEALVYGGGLGIILWFITILGCILYDEINSETHQ